MKKKILFFSNDYYPVFYQTLKLFEKYNFEIKFFKFRQTFSARKFKKIIDLLGYIKIILSEIKKFKPDFIYINDEFFSPNVFLIIILKIFFSSKSKIITFIASRYIPEPTFKKSNKFFKIFLNKIKLKFLLKNINFLFCRNKKEFKKIKENGLFKDYHRLRQLYWGVAGEFFYKINQPKKVISDSLIVLKKIYPIQSITKNYFFIEKNF